MSGGRNATADASTGPARPVQLVGSVPLPTTEEVFRLLAGKLGTLAKRLPDGETGKRSYWITSQAYLLARHPQFEPAGHNWNPDSGDVPESGAPKYRLKADVPASDVAIPPLGYAEAARESFALFSRLKGEGVIPRAVRFQVSLPTPLAFIAVKTGLSESLNRIHSEMASRRIETRKGMRQPQASQAAALIGSFTASTTARLRMKPPATEAWTKLV